jgi:anti-sigma28 factor (negative regulator of flagellin synthesis)
MSIRIESDQIGSASSPATRVDQVSRPPDQGSKSAGITNQGQDQVDVSPATAKISAELSAQNSTRASQVQQLSALYASGHYKVDSAQVSQSLVSSAIGAGNAGAGATGAGTTGTI